jgi:hypothetical protein
MKIFPNKNNQIKNKGNQKKKNKNKLTKRYLDSIKTKWTN